jgi:flavodoxin I
MKKAALVYWSGTGNTEAMAKAVAEGARTAGLEIAVKSAGDADASFIRDADAVALGCPAMGAEVLEETEMEPFVETLGQADVAGKPLVLFGSYDWGDGQWMRDWEERMKGLGAVLAADGLAVNNDPKEDDLARCRELGAKLAG